MSKTLSLSLRIIFAALGLAYIAYSLTWSDQVVVPAGRHVLSDGSSLVVEEPRSLRVVSGDFDPQRPAATLRLAVDRDSAAPRTLEVSPDQLGVHADDFRLKPGIVTTLRHADRALLLWGLLIVAPIYPITAFRWWMLMKSRGLEVGPGRAFKLSMIGCFFNYCMPGTTGGDLIKAYYAARRSDRRADSVMSVIIDRVAGLLGLVVLAGVAGLFMLHDPVARRVTIYIWLAAAAVTVVSAFYFSRRLRQASGLDWLLQRLLPRESILGKIDNAAVAYRDHKLVVFVSIMMSVPVHLCLATATGLAGRALGLETHFGLLLTVVPIIFLAGSVPLTYQGLGVMEGLGMALLLQPPIATANHIVGMLLLIRIYQIVYSLSGAVFLLQGDVHARPPVDADAQSPAPSHD